ncbi:hypothetical protein NR800_08730 [Corallococcus interemptor]|uniref:hypothetical protein n=1 Tax=Corallococcus TaxID=83461 RepID=UPI001CBBB1E4|nr:MULTISPECIES: hypothetical protein [unclassified Corallococcus]MBZ4331568.1 hypothetical protein [Corallococcus sp. AS-1-12]MBZ4371355.1 hypothetical protein [Corallococcus sp. AS-1-6]
MKLSKTLLAGAVGLILAPLTALAAPRPCELQCKPTSSCAYLCDNGGEVITCAEFGICSGLSPAAPSEPQASVQPAPSDDVPEAACRAPEARG